MKKVILLLIIVFIFSVASIDLTFRSMLINTTYAITTPLRLVSIDLLYRVGLLTCPDRYHIDTTKNNGDLSGIPQRILRDNCRGKTGFY